MLVRHKFRWMLPALLLLLALVMGAQAGRVLAQDHLDPAAPETGYGELSLQNGFAPDPYIVPMGSGGGVDIAADLGRICRGDAQGYTASPPDYRVELVDEMDLLRLFFIGNGDATLVVHGPDDRWTCDDDMGGNGQPMITFAGPPLGSYDVWVGTYLVDGWLNGQLYITAGESWPGDFYVAESQALPKDTPLPEALNINLPPLNGVTQLLEGLPEDPLYLPVQAGGPVDLYRWFPGCEDEAAGFATAAPNLRVYYGPSQTALLRFLLQSVGDTTLVINAPDGEWYCNDDVGDSLNPAITFEPAQSGWYNIWAGSFERIAYMYGDVIMTTQSLLPEELPPPVVREFLAGELVGTEADRVLGPVMELDFYGTPTFGDVTLSAGFLPDPHEVRLTSGGVVSLAEVLVSRCEEPAGFVARAPDYRIKYTGVGMVDVAWLRVFFKGSGDTTLAVRTPNARWLCDDDSGGWPHPLVDVTDPVNGTYNIWVGSYERGDIATGTLTITEQNLWP